MAQETNNHQEGKAQAADNPAAGADLSGFHLEFDLSSDKITLNDEVVDHSGRQQVDVQRLEEQAEGQDLKAKLQEAISHNPLEEAAAEEAADPAGAAQPGKEQGAASEDKSESKPESPAPSKEPEEIFEDDVQKGGLTLNGDDPDKVPVVPTLRDDEVPNMPGAILCHAREMLGLSQRDIAARLKLRVNTISDLEHDRLNQPTAAPFVRKHLAKYAELVGIDPRAVLDLYNQNVSELSARLSFGAPKKRSRGSSLKLMVYGTIFVVLAGGLIINFFMGDKEPVYEQEPLVIESALPGSEEEAAVSGELNAQAAAEGAQASETASEPVLDVNNAQAAAQAKALGSNEIAETNEAEEYSQDALTLDGASHELKIPGANTDEAALTVKAEPVTAAPKQQEIVLPEPVKPAEVAPEKTAAAQSEASKPEVKTEASAAKISEPAVNAEAQPSKEEAGKELQEEVKSEEQAPALTANLMDISNRVRLSGREGLASLNSAQVSVKKAAALKITDSRGKILASGTYKAGDKVSVTGIPPLKVAVSDTEAVSVSYMGGTVIAPKAKQASFTLPSEVR